MSGIAAVEKFNGFASLTKLIPVPNEVVPVPPILKYFPSSKRFHRCHPRYPERSYHHSDPTVYRFPSTIIAELPFIVIVPEPCQMVSPIKSKPNPPMAFGLIVDMIEFVVGRSTTNRPVPLSVPPLQLNKLFPATIAGVDPTTSAGSSSLMLPTRKIPAPFPPRVPPVKFKMSVFPKVVAAGVGFFWGVPANSVMF